MRGAAWATVQRGGIHLVNFAVLMILSRLLRPADIGLVALAMTFISAGQVVIDLGLSQALIQRREMSSVDADTVFWITLASGIGLSIGVVAFSQPASILFNEPLLSPILRWSSLSLLFVSLSATQKALLQRDLAFGRLAGRTLAAEVIGGSLGIVMAVTGFGLWSLVARNLVRDLVGVFVFWRESRWRPRLQVSVASLAEMRSFGAAVMGSRGLEFLSQSADQVLVGFFAGPTVLGYYVVGLRVVRVIRQLMVESLSAVAFPFFSRLQDEPVRLRRAFLTGLRLSTLGAFPAFLGAGLVAPEVIGLLLGPTWAPSIPVMQIMAVAALVQAAGFFPAVALLAVGKPIWRLGLNLVNSVGNVIAILIAIPQGLAGVAAGQALRAYLLFPLLLHAARVALGLGWRDYLRAWFPSLAGSAAMIVGVSATRLLLSGPSPSWGHLVLTVALGASVYILAVHAVARGALREALELFRSLWARQSGESA